MDRKSTLKVQQTVGMRTASSVLTCSGGGSVSNFSTGAQGGAGSELWC